MPEPEESDLRREAEKRVDMIVGLREHIVIYIVGMVIILAVWFFVARHFHNYFPWFLFPMFGWGIALLFHTRNVYGPRRKGRRHEVLVQRELQRLKREALEAERRVGTRRPEDLWSAEPPALDRPEPSDPSDPTEP